MKFLLAFILLFPFNIRAQKLVIDGDSLNVNNKEVRLIGIDAPEYNQTCFNGNDGSTERCFYVYCTLQSSARCKIP